MDTRYTVMLVNGYKGLTGKKQRDVRNFSLPSLDETVLEELYDLYEKIDIGIVIVTMEVKTIIDLKEVLSNLLLYALYLSRDNSESRLSEDGATEMLTYLSETEEDAEKRRARFKGDAFHTLASKIQDNVVRVLTSRGRDEFISAMDCVGTL